MNEKAKYYKTFMLKVGLFQALIVKSHRLLQSTHSAFLILLLTLHIFLPASIFAECIAGNCTKGQGTYTWPNGQKYVGEFRDGKANGQGIYTWPNGQKYVGEFRDNKANGYGIYTWPNGEKYEGEFRDDKSEGHGTYTWPNGKKYVGEFKDDKFNGQGTLTWPEGKKYEGEFKDETPNAQGNGTHPDRGRNVGEFRDDKPTVNGTFTTLTRVYVVFCGIFFFMLITLISLWYRNTVNNNLSKRNQDKDIYQNENVFKEADTIKDSPQKLPENDTEINRCYQVLDVRPGAPKEEIRKAYKDLLIVWAPDKRAEYPTLQKKAKEKIEEIDEAYEKILLHLTADNPPAPQAKKET